MKTTKVIFRTWKDTGTVIALFPEIPTDEYGRYCESYEHVGQHGGADYMGVIDETNPSDVTEYQDLKEELEQIGYTLQVLRRCTYVMDQRRRDTARQMRVA